LADYSGPRVDQHSVSNIYTHSVENPIKLGEREWPTGS
jgi:hypothetical protein